MDLTQSIEPKSDQLNAEDLLAGPQVFTVESVNAGTAEQPVNVHLVERPGRPYRPSKSMRRILVAGWGQNSADYGGRRLVLYRDPEVKFGGIAIGGIKISHMSHIDKPLKVALTVTRGKRQVTTVDPLVEQQRPAGPALASLATQSEINRRATEAGIENVPPWICEQLGRTIGGWDEITETEGDQLLKTLTTGEVA